MQKSIAGHRKRSSAAAMKRQRMAIRDSAFGLRLSRRDQTSRNRTKPVVVKKKRNVRNRRPNAPRKNG
jgi:hypothetical protein